MGVRPYKKPKGDNSDVGRLMKAAFAQDIGGQRMMRGEQIMRTHQVVDIVSSTSPSGKGCTLSAKIYSQHHGSLAPGGAYTTSINFKPIADTMLAYTNMVTKQGKWWDKLVQAARMNQKPLEQAEFKDAAALLIRAAPCHDESSFVSSTAIIPGKWSMAATASCDCLDGL